MEVICLETQAFYALVEEVVDRLKAEHNIEKDLWIPDTEAMRLLGIRSKTTLQNEHRDFKIIGLPEIESFDEACLLKWLDTKNKDIRAYFNDCKKLIRNCNNGHPETVIDVICGKISKYYSQKQCLKH